MMRYSNQNRYLKYVILLFGLFGTALYVAKTFVWDGNFSLDDAISKIKYVDNKKRLTAVQEFQALMESKGIRAILIEPNILYGMLEESQLDLLLEKGYTPSEFSGRPDVITFALLGRTRNIDPLFASKDKLAIKSFKHWPVRNDEKNTKWIPDLYSRAGSFSGHHFFERRNIVIHGVVFHRRGSYYWHAPLPPGSPSSVSREDLIFTKASAYERFKAVAVKEKGDMSALYYVPSNASFFLMEVKSSTFIECDHTRASKLSGHDLMKTGRYDMLKMVFLRSLAEMKALLHPHLKNFYIFAGTLLGWYRQCDIISYTSDVDFAAWATDIGSEAFWTKNFANGSSPLKLAELMGMPEEAFELSFRMEGYKVDLFFIYRNKSMSWAYGHRPSLGYYFSYNYPKFSLCSGDLLGHKVQVPCTSEAVLSAEYGPTWDTSVRSWYYETNPRNRGPRLFWPAEKRKNVSKYFD